MTDPGPGAVKRPQRMPLTDYAAITATVLVVLLVAGAVYLARGALLLVFVGFFLATGIEPAIQAMARRGIRRGFGLVLVVLALNIVAAGLIAVLVVPAGHELGLLADQLPARLAALGQRLGAGGPGQALTDPANHQQLQDLLSKAGSLAVASIAAVFGVLGAVLGSVFATLTVLALLIYFTLAMPRIRAGLAGSIGRTDRIEAAEAALGRIGGYVSGQLLVSAIAGLAAFAFFLLAGVPYPALLALVVGVLDAIPQIGATLASLVGVAAALTVGIGLAVATLVFFVFYQAVENYLVAPRVFSRTVEISPVAAFVAILVGGSVGGLLGAVTALPLTAAGKVILRQVADERRLATTARTSDAEPTRGAHPPEPVPAAPTTTSTTSTTTTREDGHHG